ncbi:MAG: hypothetical protein QOH69_1615 [Actinomycetota bacterium]|jgi:hypothetical protein|nr:hypothetical protein [Actinomycetota bacterium]
MEYLFFIATDTEPDVEPERAGEVQAWIDEGERRGIRKQGHRLRPVEDATTVRVRAGELLITDGPFTESKEWIDGFDIVDCENLDEAIDFASRHPMARAGRIEIRPFWPTQF